MDSRSLLSTLSTLIAWIHLYATGVFDLTLLVFTLAEILDL